MWKEILPALGVVSSVGLLAGILLAVVSRFFYVEEDETAKRLRDCLPGINCGACGFKGCRDYSKALAQGTATPNLCIPGGTATAEELGRILGVEATAPKDLIAFVACNGTKEATGKKAEYRGVNTCRGAAMLYGGPNTCVYGCIGLGDCANACPSGAICMVDGLAHVEASRCMGCGLCERTCPKQVIHMVPHEGGTVVRCANRDRGAEARKTCANACIGCKKCEKACPRGAITVKDQLARVDYERCDGCGACVSLCPTGALRQLRFPKHVAVFEE